jgi:hypothetical protein
MPRYPDEPSLRAELHGAGLDLLAIIERAAPYLPDTAPVFDDAAVDELTRALDERRNQAADQREHRIVLPVSEDEYSRWPSLVAAIRTAGRDDIVSAVFDAVEEKYVGRTVAA